VTSSRYDANDSDLWNPGGDRDERAPLPSSGYRTPGGYPPELAYRQQVVRAYDARGRIAGGVLVADGRQAEDVIRELLARSGVELVHLRNVGYGCYNFAVRANTD
jgi:hypothetical protein